MKTTTLGALDRVFNYPARWPEVGDELTNITTSLHFEVNRIRQNGEVVLRHVSFGFAIRVPVPALEDNYTMSKPHQR